MKCNHCGSEWNVNSGISASIVDCPSLLATKCKFETVEDVLIEINNQYGVNILADEKKLIAYFSDLAPHLFKQRRILDYFVECGGHRRIIAVLSATKDEQDICIKKIVKEMKEEMYVEEGAAQMICDSFLGAISSNGLIAGGKVSTTEKMKESAESGSIYKEINFEMNADGQEAERWYTIAMQANDAYSQLMLGDCYVLGKGVEKDYEEAAYWYGLSANQGELRAKCNLGILYESGKGVSQDVVKAFALYEESAKAGSSYGLLQLGLCYLRGIGTEIDTNEAYKLIYQAATMGEEYAQFKIAEGIENGTWGERDRTKAFYWYKKSADQGFLDAQTEVGRCYEKGYGVIQSDFEAAHWYQKAADRGNRIAMYRLKELDKKKITAERVSELIRKYQICEYYTKDHRAFEKKICRAISEYASSATVDTALLMGDHTILGSAKDGFVLTPSTIYYNCSNGQKGEISVRRIDSVQAHKVGGLKYTYLFSKQPNGESILFPVSHGENDEISAKVVAFWRDLLNLTPVWERKRNFVN